MDRTIGPRAAAATARRAFAVAATVAILGIAGPASPALAADPVLIAAGDISSCSSSGDSATAALVAKIAGTVVTLGHNAYDSGTSWQFANCYGPTWGTARSRTRPSVGNHEYLTSKASGYFGYFGSRAGDPAKGYYAYNLGAWRVYALNSNCSIVSCAAGSAQERWLRWQLATYPHKCVLAYWHHPRFSSGEHGNQTQVRPLWQALYDAHAEVVLNGHDHDYERFARQTPGGVASASGIREFVVGTGGRSHYGWNTVRANSQVRNSTTFGVLKLTLHTDNYEWRFVPQAGRTFTDSGRTYCR